LLNHVHLFVVDGDDQKKAHLSVGASSEVSLKVTEADISNLTASIRSPSGLEEPCVLKRLANGHLGTVWISFIFIHSFHFISGPWPISRKNTKDTKTNTHTQTQIKLMNYENC